MKILLIQPPIRDFYRTEFREYPLGLLYLAASLEKAGFEAEILDARKCAKPQKISLPGKLSYLNSFYTKENNLFLHYKHFGMLYEEIAKCAAAASPDAICISSMFTPYVEEVIDTARAIKKVLTTTPIIAGGHHASVDPNSLLNSGVIDKVIIGEGENKLPAVIASPSRVPRGEAIPMDLNLLPLPARHLISSDRYKLGKKNYTMILTSRGCPHRCSFCSVHTVCGTEHRTRNIDGIINEIEECVKHFKIEAFDFQDDNLLFDSDRIKILFENIILKFEGKIELLASNGLNVSSLDDELLHLMKRAGFRKLDIALGTGAVPSRRNLQRPESIAKYETVLQAANSIGIPVTTYIILGIPTQPLEEMRETIEHLKTKNTLIAPSIFYNVPGMPIFEECKRFEYCHEHLARRSSAFNNFGVDFVREDVLELFKDIRKHNLGLNVKSTNTR